MSNTRIVNTAIGRVVVPAPLPPQFALYYTTRDFFGSLSDEAAAQLMGVVRDEFGIEATLTTCTQVHGATVRRANADPRWRECDSCDALWSSETHSALGIKVADCLPVTMVDPTHHVIANVHSGWRGTVQQITAATIGTIARETAFDPASSYAYLGPSIRACCFEVGEEVVEQFTASYGDVTPYVDRSQAKPHIDSPRITRDVLRRAGFADERIIDTELCTRCEGSIFHSFRREGKGGGRNLAVAAQ